MPQIMALDYGSKRTGIAVSDDMQIIASGLTTVATADLFEFLEGYLSENDVELFVVGLPLQMDNSPSESEDHISSFVEKLGKLYPDKPIKRVDERFTSKMAVRTMIDSGLKKKKRREKGLIDEISATIILQSYLYNRKDEKR